MTARYGAVRVSKIIAAIQAVRVAIQHGDPVETREAWDRLEAWLPWLFAEDKKHAPERCPYCDDGKYT